MLVEMSIWMFGIDWFWWARFLCFVVCWWFYMWFISWLFGCQLVSWLVQTIGLLVCFDVLRDASVGCGLIVLF